MQQKTVTLLIINTTENARIPFRQDLEGPDRSIIEVPPDAPREPEEIAARQPDIVLFVIAEPGQGWSRLLARTCRGLAGTPVIAIFTRDIAVDDVRLAFQAGAFDCLPGTTGDHPDWDSIIEGVLREIDRRRIDETDRERMGQDLRSLESTVSFLENELRNIQEALRQEHDKRQDAEEMAYRNQQTFHIMFENTRDAIIHLNREGFVVNTNGTIKEVFGLTPEEVLGKDLSAYDFLGFDYRQALELYKEPSPDIPFPAFEMEAFHKNGARIYIETQAKQIFSQAGIEGVINIVRNITPQKKLEHAKNATILGLAKLAESRDDSTGGHLERVREYVRMITRAISRLPKYAGYISPAYIQDIYLSSILHDIGKVSVPDAILLKPGRLTPPEFEIIKQHTIVGGNALAAVDAELREQSFLTLGKEIAYYHHESWDGHGYPEGLKGENIPLSARIVALADVYDALTTRRVYKEAYSHQQAVDIILSEKGKKFDPEIVDAFEVNMEEFDRIRQRISGRDPIVHYRPKDLTRSPISCQV